MRAFAPSSACLYVVWHAPEPIDSDRELERVYVQDTEMVNMLEKGLRMRGSSFQPDLLAIVGPWVL